MTVRRFSFRRSQAFTLLEAVFSTALVLLVLILMGNFLQQLQRGQQTREQNQQAAQAEQTALNVLAADVRAAVTWRVASGVSLDFDLPNDQHPDFQPLNPLPPPEPVWNPLAKVIRVRYRVLNRQLLREASTGGAFRAVPLLDDVDSFQVHRNSPQELQVTVILPGLRIPRTLTRSLDLPIEAAWSQP